MKERPILFKGEMVRAILDGRKTQTRRVLKPQPVFGFGNSGCWYPQSNFQTGGQGKGLHYGNESHFRKGAPIDFTPFGQPGDRLWVRETWVEGFVYEDNCPTDQEKVWYRADGKELDWDHSGDKDHCNPPWRPSIHMPRWASRINLEITNVRVERINMISGIDAQSEGIRAVVPDGDISDFADLWDSLAKPGSKWADHPWVWVIEFKKI